MQPRSLRVLLALAILIQPALANIALAENSIFIGLNEEQKLVEKQRRLESLTPRPGTQAPSIQTDALEVLTPRPGTQAPSIQTDALEVLTPRPGTQAPSTQTDALEVLIPRPGTQAPSTQTDALEVLIPRPGTQASSTQTDISDENCHPLNSGFSENYDGECKNGLPNGHGKAKGSLGSYRGDFVNGLFQGKGKIFYYNTSQSYEGEFYKGLRHGTGYIIDPSTGNPRLAQFKDDDFVTWKEPSDTSNNGVTYTSTPAYQVEVNNYNRPPMSGLYIGKLTPYGRIVSISAQYIAVEKTVYDKDGYKRQKIVEYPASLFEK